MSARPYSPVYWTDNEPVFTEKMNAMANNTQWVFENLPTVYYNGYGVKKTSGTKILAANVLMRASTSGATASTFYFGNFFSVGCKPIITMSANIYPQGRMHLYHRGIGTLFPDHRGFEVRASSDEISGSLPIRANFWVPFHAVGY